MDPVRGGVIAAILDFGFFPAVAGRAYARIFDSREECSRAQSRETRIAHAKAAKVGKGERREFLMLDSREDKCCKTLSNNIMHIISVGLLILMCCRQVISTIFA